MSYQSRILKKADKVRREIQNVATGGLSDEIGEALGRKGVPTSTRDVADRLIGSRNRGAIGLSKGGKARPKVKVGSTVCGDGVNEVAGLRYTFAPMISLAAGAKAIDADLGDFLDAAASSEVTADNTMPWDYVIESAQLTVGVNLTAASAVENLAAILGQAVLIFKEHGQEKARWPLGMFNPNISYAGTPTAASAVANVAQFNYDPMEFEEPIYLMEGKPYSFEVRIMGVAVTTVNVVQLAMAFEGFRV